MALSRAPAPDLQPWFYWITVAEADIAPGVRIDCGRIIEHPSITILFHDAWTATDAEGTKVLDPGPHGKAFYFGPHTRCMPLSIAGKWIVISILFQAGAAQLLGLPDPADTLDRVYDLDELLGGEAPVASLVPREAGYDEWAEAIEERFLRPLIQAKGVVKPARLVADFQKACLTNPEMTVEQFARRQDVSKRTVERVIKKAFGVSPKQALRRARAQDFGAALLGVARPEDAPEIEDRYFDQSHRIKEMRAIFGVSPGELRKRPHPVLALSLEVRQRRRLEVLHALEPGELGPWRDPASEPGPPPDQSKQP
ncbi:helix-turn-helix domain-containing protein [Erythrobacter arachoides]|uniref:Helix-turn-helix domain-containing protein n=1 Tax=Aurantiacibacter arachoides TaxID=1850444 RepID=A0A845A5W7_9SPHN|nr:DUF6597 domain-containing transcriptional factor [Aurantiacibacter arachoides]MXO94546.1 helix-turn-helix domain-containing protein [Aurantiacibacter arachoides]GGD62636.1 hypothetical protein GCM10011411_23600 [Aurantiacibacter arachoides]